MNSINIRAIVCRYVNYKEYDRILTLFSRELGRIDAAARGCRRPKSKLLSSSQLFCYGDFELFKKDDRYSVSSCSVRHMFFDIISDIEKFSTASYMLAVCQHFANPGEESNALFNMLINVLAKLEEGVLSCQNALLIFLLQLTELIGYKPEFNICLSCGSKIRGKAHFDIGGGGMLCDVCSDKTANLGEETLLDENVLKKMQEYSVVKVSGLGRMDDEKEETATACILMQKYLSKHADLSIKLYDFSGSGYCLK